MSLVFKTIQTEGIAELSYIVGDDDEGIAAVFDPRPDCDIYIEMAREAGVAITHIFETHIHADLVSGSRELSARLDSAKIFGSLHRYAQICAEQSIEAVQPKYLTSEHRAEISREGMCNLSHCYRAI